jgi:hypothetical protein
MTKCVLHKYTYPWFYNLCMTGLHVVGVRKKLGRMHRTMAAQSATAKPSQHYPSRSFRRQNSLATYRWFLSVHIYTYGGEGLVLYLEARAHAAASLHERRAGAKKSRDFYTIMQTGVRYLICNGVRRRHGCAP